VNTFFDTPTGNLPYPVTWQLVEIIANQLIPLAGSFVDSIFGEACNKRLGTQNLTLVELANVAASRNITLGELIAMPEQDDWVYSDGLSMVCDVFFCSIAKHAGILGPVADQIQCTEFQNVDAYSLAIFDTTTPPPAACQAADPTLPYCQLLGNWTLQLPNANTLTPYANMRQTCTSLPIDYTWAPGC
jgi:hypothetical protein